MSHYQVPTGAILPFAGTVAPSGYLFCNGAAVSRTNYAKLFAVIGVSHGYGDNSTTFNIPDYRGRFLRGVDGGAARDPDRAARGAMNLGGNTGDAVGTIQGHEMVSHTHSQNSHSHQFNVSRIGVPTGGSGVFDYLDGGLNNTANNRISGATATNNNTGGNETRPINAGVHWIIKI